LHNVHMYIPCVLEFYLDENHSYGMLENFNFGMCKQVMLTVFFVV